MPTEKERIQARIDEYRAKLRKIENKEKAEQRKLDTRKKVLIGGVVNLAIRDNKLDSNTLNQWLDEYLKRPIDRKIFGLDTGSNAE